MDNLESLLEGYTTAFMKYPEERRAIEAKFMRAVVAEIKALKAAQIIDRLPRVPDNILDQHIADLPGKIAAHVENAKRKPGRPPKQEAV